MYYSHSECIGQELLGTKAHLVISPGPKGRGERGEQGLPASYHKYSMYLPSPTYDISGPLYMLRGPAGTKITEEVVSYKIPVHCAELVGRQETNYRKQDSYKTQRVVL